MTKECPENNDSKLDKLWMETRKEQFKSTLKEIISMDELNFLHERYKCKFMRDLVNERIQELNNE